MNRWLLGHRWLVRAAAVAPLSLAFLAFMPATATAQQGYYVPPGGSPFSPYLDLYRRDTGLLNQYYNFIIPRRQLTETLNQQRAAITNLQTQVQSNRAQLRPTPTARIGPTGVGSVYMNYSHYYGGSR
jgi:hypothetical protein